MEKPGIEVYIFLLFTLIFCYLAIKGVLSKKPAFGHEASYIVAIGFLINLAATLSGGSGADFIKETLVFDDNVLFYVCIPPIVFA